VPLSGWWRTCGVPNGVAGVPNGVGGVLVVSCKMIPTRRLPVELSVSLVPDISVGSRHDVFSLMYLYKDVSRVCRQLWGAAGHSAGHPAEHPWMCYVRRGAWLCFVFDTLLLCDDESFSVLSRVCRLREFLFEASALPSTLVYDYACRVQYRMEHGASHGAWCSGVVE